MIRLTKITDRDAVQATAPFGEAHWQLLAARYFYDKKNFPGGTPADGKINVIRSLGKKGEVVARVETVAEAIAVIEALTGLPVQIVERGRRARDEMRAEARIS
jgi:hypothetical protein